VDIVGQTPGGYAERMDQLTFVDLLQSVVLDGLASELAQSRQQPPGRFRSEERSRRSEWLSKMSGPDRELLEAFGAEAARAAIFGMLCVLDGSRTIEESSAGYLELRHISEGGAELLASSALGMPVLPLHELLP